MLADTMTNIGYEAFESENGEEAVDFVGEIVRKNEMANCVLEQQHEESQMDNGFYQYQSPDFINSEFDVIFMNCFMVNMNGATATRIIREFGYRGIIIGIGSNIAHTDEQKFLRDGADIVLNGAVDSFDFIEILDG
jgi:CheY-like chemotaxis protein